MSALGVLILLRCSMQSKLRFWVEAKFGLDRLVHNDIVTNYVTG